MKIRYRVDMEDLVAFNQYFVDHSRYVQRLRRLNAGIVVVIYIILGIFLSFTSGSWLHVPIWIVVGLVISICIYLRGGRVKRRRVSKIYREGKNKGILCEHEIEITHDGIMERTDFGEQKCIFASIEKIGRTDKHGFIFLGSMLAHIVPKEKVIAGSFDEFFSVLEEKWKSKHSTE